MKTLFYILPVLAGVAMSIQSGVNSQLRAATQHPVLSAFISFVGGTLALAVLLFLSKQPVPSFQSFSSIEWYKFTGGLLGVAVVYIVLLSVQEVGAANLFVLIVAGQLLTAVVMDHFGVLGMKESPINLQKVLGILLVIAGAYLVNRK